jgi:hypothetical protein
MLARLRCYLRRRHQPVRYPLGGFKCAACGRSGADLREMGFDDGYVSLSRTAFSRTQGGTGRRSWEEGEALRSRGALTS